MPDTQHDAAADTQNTQERCGFLDPVLLSVAIFWGGNFVAYKYLMALISPAALLVARYVLITLLLLGLVAARGRLRSGNSPMMWLHIGLAGLLIMGLQQIAFVTGLNLTAAGEGSLLFSTAPIFTALIAAAIGQEQVRRGNWIGIAAAMAGCTMVILGGAGAEHVPETRITGDLLMLASAIGYVLFMVVSKPLMLRYGALKVVGFSYLFGLLLIVPFGARDAMEADWGSLGSAGWFWMGWLVILAGAYGFAAWYWRISRTTPSRVAVYQYMVPVVAMVTAALLLAERPAAIQIGGAVLVLAGLYFARRDGAATCPS